MTLDELVAERRRTEVYEVRYIDANLGTRSHRMKLEFTPSAPNLPAVMKLKIDDVEMTVFQVLPSRRDFRERA
jgi:hypothetical protein